MTNVKIGDELIPFSLTGVDDKTYSPDNYSDKKVLVVFFTCNHCPYVLAWEDRIIALQKEYASKGVQFIAIGSNDATKKPADSFPKMKEHADEKGFNFPYLHDSSQAIATAYGAERTPEFFVFDQDRKLAYHGVLDDNVDNPSAVVKMYLRDALDAVIAGESPATTEVAPVGCTIKWRD